MTDSQLLNIIVTGAEPSRRLDRVLALHVADQSRSRLKALIVEGRVAIGGRVVSDPAYHVGAGETITIDIPAPMPARPAAEMIPLVIIHEDDSIIVIDKPAGLVVHPAPGHHGGTLVNALIAHCGDSLSGIGGERRPGIVHRLDKDTSGLLVVAKTDRAHRSLAKQFADHGRTGDLRRGYQALVWGAPERPHGTITLPIGRHSQTRDKMAVRNNGRMAITHWNTEAVFRDAGGKPVAAAVACQLETGRTHQIRVHLAHVGHPLMGDDTYGAGYKTKRSQLGETALQALERLGRQALHAAHLTIRHPVSGEVLTWTSRCPQDMEDLRQALSTMDSLPATP